ncbi:MAG: nucleotidyl transferase AbiEii/AbiGii toxin family protein [Patescibacteria group bacterium]|jgi:predicted nucleotidyltransferase component of viral defense system|nr:nucleotidyl transferase AbiEii/AbiGii toxin family protein [Patescibacteria group bacterium]
MTSRGFNPDKHKAVLRDLLYEIIKVVGSKVVFKGGTAAMMFYDLPRLSLDLDIDMLFSPSDEILDELNLVIRKSGVIKEHKDKKFTLFYLLSYEENYPNIKIEFNKRIWKNNSSDIFLLSDLEIKVADKKTLFTNKLVALTDRRISVSRDLFDVNYFLKLNFPINESLIYERTGKSKIEYMKYLIKYIKDNYNEKNVLHGLGEFLDKNQKTWAKNNLINETISLLKTKC